LQLHQHWQPPAADLALPELVPLAAAAVDGCLPQVRQQPLLPLPLWHQHQLLLLQHQQ
jgi:hypothetical protein